MNSKPKRDPNQPIRKIILNNFKKNKNERAEEKTNAIHLKVITYISINWNSSLLVEKKKVFNEIFLFRAICLFSFYIFLTGLLDTRSSILNRFLSLSFY